MSKQANLILLSSLVLLLCSCRETADCIDFLSAWQVKPKELKFLSCKKVEKTPAIVLEASYSIQGHHAKSVEDLLHKKFGMEKLRFVCCGWETRPVTYTDEVGSTYTINMHSNDDFKGNKNWESFSEFQVTVEKYVVLP